MRRGRTLLLVLLLIIVLGVVGFVLFTQLLGSGGGGTGGTPQVQYVDVYYAAQSITQGQRIAEDVLSVMSIPQDKVVTVMYTVDELPFLVDKISKYNLEPGVLITESMVTDSSAGLDIEGPQWASIIPPGMTAISIPADRLSVSGYAINNGAHVNVNVCLLFVDVDPTYQTILPNQTAILTGTGLGGTLEGAQDQGFRTEGLPILSLGIVASGAAQGRLELDPSVQQPYYVIPSEQQRPRTVCQTLLQDVVVMRLGNFPLTGADVQQDANQEADPNAAPADTLPPDLVTLIVTPQDSITLSYLTYTNARISLTLRNPSDMTRVATEASTLQFLLSQYNIPVPAKLPYAMHPAISALISPTLLNDIPQEEQ